MSDPQTTVGPSLDYLASDEQMTRRRMGEYYPYGDELRLLAKYARRHDCTLDLCNPSAPTYQVAKFRTEGVSLVIYPHKTSAGNYHLRVRNENSKNKELAAWIMRDLYKESGLNCTFSTHVGYMPTDPASKKGWLHG